MATNTKASKKDHNTTREFVFSLTAKITKFMKKYFKYEYNCIKQLQIWHNWNFECWVVGTCMRSCCYLGLTYLLCEFFLGLPCTLVHVSLQWALWTVHLSYRSTCCDWLKHQILWKLFLNSKRSWKDYIMLQWT
jgi:hypothetical protein